MGGLRLFDQTGQAVDLVRRIRNDEQATAGEQPGALAIDVRGFDARPGLDQRDRGGARPLADRDEESFSGFGLEDHPLIEENVFLEPSLEVVAEGGVRGRGQEVPIVGLDQAALAQAMTAHLVADGNDPPNRLVPGDGEDATRGV